MYSKDVLELLGDHGGRLVLLEEHLLVQARVQTGAVYVHPVLPLDVGVEGGHIDGQGLGLVLVELLLGSEPKNNKEKQHETLKLAFRLI